MMFGAVLLFLQNQPLWRCAYITVGVACVSAFGLGLSHAVRINTAVMLPSIFSGIGQNLVLLVFVSSLVSGPVSNILHNTELAASSLVCSAQLTANQTQELLRRAAAPLSSVLDSLREISSNAYDAAGRIQNLIESLTDSVRHVARTLRNLLHFLVDIGDICNEEMGAPYRKCRQLFSEARLDCSEVLGDFNFLCEIMENFLPLCELARAGELFCVVPSYVAQQLRRRLAAPVVAALEKLKQEFEFDLTATVTFDLEANSSQSLQEVSQHILEELSLELQLLEALSQPLDYICVILLLWSYSRAACYRRRYLQDLDFDNVYISAAFMDLDHHVTSGGGASVLPITARESRTYTRPLSLRLSNQERRVVMVGVTSVLRQMLIGGVLVALDFLVFWILDQVHHQASGDIVARAPVLVQVQVNGSGFAADVYRDLVNSFQVLQSHNVTVFSRICVVQPREPDLGTCLSLGFFLGLALLLSVFKGFVQRCRRVVCSWFHPGREQERLEYLRRKILEQRRSEKRALSTAFFRKRAAGVQGPVRGRDQGRVLALLLRCPCVPRVSRLLGLNRTCCLSCGDVLSPESTVHCDSPHCNGVYCGVCVLRWRNTCVACARPLTSKDYLSELSDLELGSSDEDDTNQDQKHTDDKRPDQDPSRPDQDLDVDYKEEDNWSKISEAESFQAVMEDSDSFRSAHGSSLDQDQV